MGERLLPGILATIEVIAGRDAASIAKVKGGREKVYVPRPEHLRPDHWLVQAVGFDAARRIAATEGGMRHNIPRGPFGRRGLVHHAIERALAEGKSVAEAAQLAGVDQRTVRRHKHAISRIASVPDSAADQKSPQEAPDTV